MQYDRFMSCTNALFWLQVVLFDNVYAFHQHRHFTSPRCDVGTGYFFESPLLHYRTSILKSKIFITMPMFVLSGYCTLNTVIRLFTCRESQVRPIQNTAHNQKQRYISNVIKTGAQFYVINTFCIVIRIGRKQADCLLDMSDKFLDGLWIG